MEKTIENLFKKFLQDEIKGSNDIEYCLLQSTVEPTIRFKFGSWLYSNKDDHGITLNLMEANRIDLVVAQDDKVYFIEFGHLLNLLGHGNKLNQEKVNNDLSNIELKVDKMINKINKEISFNFFKHKKIILVTISLFSDIKVGKKSNKYEVLFDINRLNSGTLYKYGNSFTNQKYFDRYEANLIKKVDYEANLKNDDSDEEFEFLRGYEEFPIIKEKLSLHYKFKLLDYKPKFDYFEILD